MPLQAPMWHTTFPERFLAIEVPMRIEKILEKRDHCPHDQGVAKGVDLFHEYQRGRDDTYVDPIDEGPQEQDASADPALPVQPIDQGAKEDRHRE